MRKTFKDYVNNNTQYGNQADQHEKEERFIKFLSYNYTQHWKTYSRASKEQDIKDGIDVFLDDIPYDLKISFGRLSLFKKHKGNWYSPIVEHMDINYLYVIEYSDKFALFTLKKEDILMELLKNKIQFSEYSGDGNFNINMDLERRLSILDPKPVILRKSVGRTLKNSTQIEDK